MASALELRAINAVRVLSADIVEKANSGHPGAPMGCAPIAHALFANVMRYNPANPKWVSRLATAAGVGAGTRRRAARASIAACARAHR